MKQILEHILELLRYYFNKLLLTIICQLSKSLLQFNSDANFFLLKSVLKLD